MGASGHERNAVYFLNDICKYSSIILLIKRGRDVRYGQ